MWGVITFPWLLNAQDSPRTKDIVDTHGVVNTTFNCDDSTTEKQVCKESDTGLPARVLPRSYSQLYQSPQANETNTIPTQVTAFRPLYVFNQQAGQSANIKDDGWYQVGTNAKEPLGWIQAKDAMQWKQALVVSYTHPGDEVEGRKPTIMFDNVASLQHLLDSDDLEDKADAIYQQIDHTGTAPSVVSMEPKRFIDIRKNPFFLPITAWKHEEINGEDVNLLEISAAVPNQRGADTLQNPDYRKNANVARSKGEIPSFDDTAISIIFVVDTTLSMQPYINRTRDAIRQISQQIETTSSDGVRFGLVGYRDSTAQIPKIEYTAKNFTPKLLGADELGNLLDSVKATKVNSNDEAEEVFAGLQTAIEANWQSDHFRFIILIGDASGHDRDHPYNTTTKNHEDIKLQLKQNGIHLLAIHLQSKRKAALKDKPIALTQYGHLSKVAGSNEDVALITVDTKIPGDFDKSVKRVIEQFFHSYELAKVNQQGDHNGRDNTDTSMAAGNEHLADNTNTDTDQATTAVNRIFQAALIEYIGQAATPPKDITAWVADRDLTDLSYKSLQVHVVLTKEQLSSLSQALKQVLNAFKQADSSQQEFFTALQQVAGQTMKRPEDIASAARLSETGLLPKFITGLPYKSDILTLNNDMFASMTSTQRAELELALKAKLQQYYGIIENTDLWQLTNPDDPNSTKIYPLPLDFLP